ncbi:MAG: sigma-70 factor domain-containing protein, partial [Patescibacteria group bacterium]
MKTKNKKKNKKRKKLKIKKAKKIKKQKKTKVARKKTIPKSGAKKLSRVEKRAQGMADLSSGLIEKGRKRGFITYDEILKTFPDIENNILFLDELYEKLGVAGIDVLEGGNLLNLDIDLNDKDLNKGSMHDSIQMYLKEIGQYPLIHGNDEKELAKRIEHGDLEAKNLLARAN